MNPRMRGGLVEAAASSIGHGGQSLETAAVALERLIDEGAWREFETRDGRPVFYEKFEEFVTTPPLRGLGSTLDRVRSVIGGNVGLVNRLDEVLRNPHGGDRSKVYNIHVAKRASGTSRDAALRSLRDHAPDLHERVLAGELSAHAATLKAGLRNPRVSIRTDDAASIARTLRRKVAPEVLAELRELLGEDES